MLRRRIEGLSLRIGTWCLFHFLPRHHQAFSELSSSSQFSLATNEYHFIFSGQTEGGLWPESVIYNLISTRSPSGSRPHKFSFEIRSKKRKVWFINGHKFQDIRLLTPLRYRVQNATFFTRAFSSSSMSLEATLCVRDYTWKTMLRLSVGTACNYGFGVAEQVISLCSLHTLLSLVENFLNAINKQAFWTRHQP